MLNERLNNGSRNELGNKFRDKKFVSAVAIGVFVLILLIVLVAKGCGSKSRAQRRQRQAQQTAAYHRNQQQPVQPKTTAAPAGPVVAPATVKPAPAPVAPPKPRVAPVPAPAPRVAAPAANNRNTAANSRKAASDKLIRDGRRYLNGENGVKPDYAKAKTCFEQAKKLGNRNADAWLRVCQQKMKNTKRR